MDETQLSDSSNRRLDEVKEILHYAKLDENDLKSEIQTIWFSRDAFNEGGIKLLELDEHLLEYVCDGNSLVIRGDDDERAVICTKDSTYTIKEAETSNSLLILPELSFVEEQEQNSQDEKNVIRKDIIGIYHTYYELNVCKPKLQKLRHLCEKCVYQGREKEEDVVRRKKFTLADLLDRVQASEYELLDGLRQIQAFKIQGYWRLLDFEYEFRVLSHILNFVEENSWAYNEIEINSVLDVLQELEPVEILKQTLDYYGREIHVTDGRGSIYELNQDKICRCFAQVMLRPVKKMNLSEFEESWKLVVPTGMSTDLKQLDGLVMVDRDSHPESISYFPVWQLSEDVELRFNELFKLRSKWSYDDIRPFVQDLTTDKLDVNSLLTKFARISTQNGVRVYTSKRPMMFKDDVTSTETFLSPAYRNF